MKMDANTSIITVVGEKCLAALLVLATVNVAFGAATEVKHPDPMPADEAAWKSAIDLLPLIDPQIDTVKGEWRFTKDGLLGDLDSYCRIEIPYKPPEEYDFRIEFTNAGKSGSQFLSREGHDFTWRFFVNSKNGPDIFGFSTVKGLNIFDNPTRTQFKPPELSGRHVSLVEVRKDVVRGYFDGKLVVEWKTDYSDLSTPAQYGLRTPGVLGIGCQARTLFQSVQVREVIGKGTGTRSVIWPSAKQEAFIRQVAALPPQQQIVRVIAGLKELNPDFDGQEAHKIEINAVTELSFSTVGVTNIRPLMALKKLKKLVITPPTADRKGTLADLSPLKDLPLTGLWCHNNPISNLGPLRGLPLAVLSVGGTQVDNLWPLRGLKLGILSCNDTPVADLAPLQDMSLTVLWCHNTKVTTLSPVGKMPLQELKCDFVAERDTALLRGIKTLAKINDLPAAAFLARVGALKQPSTTTTPGAVPSSTQASNFRTSALVSKTQTGLLSLAQQTQVRDEVRRFCAKVKGFTAVDLPASGKVVLSRKNSLTIDMLRGVAIDDNPPVRKPSESPPDNGKADDSNPSQGLHVAPGIEPFRFRFFNNEFNIGGRPMMAAQNYASDHGFNIIQFRAGSYQGIVPPNTKRMNWGPALSYKKLFEEHNIPEGRYDLLAGLDLEACALQEFIKPDRDLKPIKINAPDRVPLDQYMIDIEEGVRSPDNLRNEAWYPLKGSPSERAAFEKKYYDGYAQIHLGPIRALRKLGYKNLSLYGWQPHHGSWFVPRKTVPDSKNDWAWNAYGKQIYAEMDILNPSVYVPYWAAHHVAGTLLIIENQFKMIAQERVAKPIRPYYWHLLNSGGGGWRWWGGLPLTMEEARAMATMGFFTGFDGVDLWGGSNTNEDIPRIDPKSDPDCEVGRRFEWKAEGAATPTVFLRYDAIHVTEMDANGNVKFQKINKKASVSHSFGTGPDKPFYLMPKNQLLPNLRAKNEPISAFIEGLALAKSFEYLLRHGDVKIDVPTVDQLEKALPVVRRVKLGQWHVLATYDQNWEDDPRPKEIELKNFDGHAGLTVVLPADAQTRIFLLSSIW